MDLENDEQVNELIRVANTLETIQAKKFEPLDPVIIIKDIGGHIEKEELVLNYIKGQNAHLNIGNDGKEGFKLIFTRPCYNERVRLGKEKKKRSEEKEICEQTATTITSQEQETQAKIKSTSYDAIFRVSKQVFQKLSASNRKICIDDQRIRVNKFIPYTQCIKCCKLGHTEKRCNSETYNCLYCSKDHRTKECPNQQELCCFNCKRHNQISEEKRETKHMANFGKCESILEFKSMKHDEIQW